MLINIIDVSPEQTLTNKNGKNYKQIEVTYKNAEGKASSKKLFDFNKGAYDNLKGLAKGTVVEITTVKNGDYWDWTAATVGPTSTGSTGSSSDGGSASKSSTSGGTYATKEERAVTQVYIVKQNALTNAANLLKSEKKVPTAKEVTELAQELANWTLGIDKKDPNSFDDFEDDIPV